MIQRPEFSQRWYKLRMSSTLVNMIFLQENKEFVRRDSLWTEGSAVAGRPPCSSACLTPSLISPCLSYSLTHWLPFWI